MGKGLALRVGLMGLSGAPVLPTYFWFFTGLGRRLGDASTKGRMTFGSLLWVMNNQLRTGTDKGNPTV